MIDVDIEILKVLSSTSESIFIAKKSNTARKPSDLGNIIEIKTTNYDINPLLISIFLRCEAFRKCLKYISSYELLLLFIYSLLC